MGLTKQYLRYAPVGTCNVVASSGGAVVAIDQWACAVAACESVSIYNMRTVDRISELREGEKGVTCLKLSNDKRYMAVGYADGAVRLFDRQAEDQNTAVVFSGHKKGVNCLAFSADGLTLASGGKDTSIILWDIVSESGLFRLNGHKDSVTHLQFAHDGNSLISSSKDTFIKMWSLASQTCFYTLTDSRSEIYSFCLLKEDSLLVVATTELELIVYSLEWLDGTVGVEDSAPSKKKARQPNSLLPLIQKDEDDMENRFVRVHPRGKLLRQGGGRALQLAASHDGQLLVCVGSEKQSDVYRVFSDEEAMKRLKKKMTKAKKRAAESSEAAPSEADVARDVTVEVQRVGDFRHAAKTKWADFAPQTRLDGDVLEYRLFSLMMNNNVIASKLSLDLAKNTATVEAVADLDQLGHREDIRSMSFASNNSCFATGGGDQVMLWNAHSLRPVNTLKDEAMRHVTGVLFATGDAHLIAATKNGELHVWETATCELLETVQGAHEGGIWSIAALPDGKGFVTASADKKLKFWNYELKQDLGKKRLTVRETRQLELSDEALSVAISPNGKFVVVGLLDSTAAVYFLDSLKFFLSLYGHSLPVTCVSISPDSRMCVTGSADKSIKVWGLDFGDCHKSFHAHDEAVSAVMYSPNVEEITVWSAGRDGKIRQWDPVKFEKVQTLELHSAEIRCLAQNHSGNMILSASHDKSLRAWELTEEIIVLQEEEEMEREKEYEARLLDEDDVVPGESAEGETGLAAAKTASSVVSTENIIDAVDIVRNERVQQAEDAEHTPHPLIKAYGSKSLDHFIVDTMARVRSANLERSLLLVPLSYVADLLCSLSAVLAKQYKVEFCARTAIFLIRVHHSHMINSVEMLPVLEQLRKEMPSTVERVRDVCGLNLAALKYLQLELEEQQDVKLFADVSALGATKKGGKKKKERTAIIKANT